MLSAPSRTPPHRAFTLIELLVVVAIIASLVLFLVLSSAPRGNRTHARQLKDSYQVRNMVQAMGVWASNNKDRYPLPSEIDTDNATVSEIGDAKNTTANILSVMIFNGNISPEMCVSPAESNTGQVQRMEDYQFTSPKLAANPAKALWDPAFRGTPDDPVRNAAGSPSAPGNQSYAHVLPFGKRLAQWKSTGNVNQAIFGNRGPTYAQTDTAPSSAKWALLPGPLGTESNTLLIHGARRTWEGNIGYNDVHVEFETKPTPSNLFVGLAAPPSPGKLSAKTAPDNLFVNESDEFEGDGITGGVTAGTNAYLRPISRVIPGAAAPTVNVWRD